LVNNARFYAGRCGTTAETTWINPMPLFHTAGCGMVTLGSMQAGCRMILMAQFDPAVVLQMVQRERANIILGVPTMILALVEAQGQSPVDCASMQLISSGGAMVPPELVRAATKAFGCPFSILYGQTEYSPTITQHHSTDSFDDICNTVGQPVDQTAVSIRRPSDNAVVPVGEVGEICVRGPCTMLGYHGNPQATAETIDTDGWLHTGDLGTMDERGYVRVTGRVKEMIIRGGENFFPAEIENALLEHPSIAEIAVVGLPDEKWGEIIAAFYRTEGDVEVDVADLRSHCRAHLAPQKTPAVWERVTEFPLTGSGKIQKFSLRDQYLARQKA
jgi:fatty-acyl-CoA synthase